MTAQQVAEGGVLGAREKASASHSDDMFLQTSMSEMGMLRQLSRPIPRFDGDNVGIDRFELPLPVECEFN